MLLRSKNTSLWIKDTIHHQHIKDTIIAAKTASVNLETTAPAFSHIAMSWPPLALPPPLPSPPALLYILKIISKTVTGPLPWTTHQSICSSTHTSRLLLSSPSVHSSPSPASHSCRNACIRAARLSRFSTSPTKGPWCHISNCSGCTRGCKVPLSLASPSRPLPEFLNCESAVWNPRPGCECGSCAHWSGDKLFLGTSSSSIYWSPEPGRHSGPWRYTSQSWGTRPPTSDASIARKATTSAWRTSSAPVAATSASVSSVPSWYTL